MVKDSCYSSIGKRKDKDIMDNDIMGNKSDKKRSLDPRVLEELYSAFEAADNIILKKYVAGLSSSSCIEMDDKLKAIKVGDNVSLYQVAKIVYDKTENIQDKLTTVYSSIFSLDNCGLIMLIIGKKDCVNLYLGVATRNLVVRQDAENKIVISALDTTLSENGKVLKNSFVGNFPGTQLKPVQNETYQDAKTGASVFGKKDIIKEAFSSGKYVSAVSSVPAIRNVNEHKNQEFVQGLEKLIDTLKGKEYSAVIIADAMSNSKIEEMCTEYEDIYSQLAPFKASSQTFNKQTSVADTESFITGVTNTTNKTVSKSLSHGTSESKTHTNSGGGSVSAGGEVFGGSISYNHSYAKGKTESEQKTDTTSTGTAKSLTEQNSVAKSLTESNSESLQINFENRAVKTLLDRIDEQIVRLRSCEDFGMFDTCAYFTAKDYEVAIAAASAFKSITRGENSSVESSAVNVWKNEQDVECIKDYLKRFYHPEFVTYIDEKHQYSTTATMLISGREMSYQMALPKKSVAGVPVVECAEFGREVNSLNNISGNVNLGNVFHMHNEEPVPVNLDSNELTAHTFITGSTGSGKSTTVYKLINELCGKPSGKDNNVKFMVIEPAKGEYKNALASNKKFDIRVFGTNPRITKLLRINPFRFPSDKIHIYEHLDKLTEIFNVCWPMYAAMPAVLKAAMENAYCSAGWNLVKSENKNGDIFPSFVDVAIEVEKYINKSEYSDENKSNYKGSLLTRLESLTNGINSMIFSANDIEDEELFDENVIVDLSRVGSTETKALIMGVLILKLQEHRIATTTESNAGLKHITILEEAHNLLKRTSTEQSSESSNLLGKSVEMLANSIAEMRTYGEGFVIADQSPGLLDLSVIRNTNTKIIMRLPDFSDRELVGKAAGLNDDQIVELSKLPRGVAAVCQSDWISPVLCKVEKPNLKDDNYNDGEGYSGDDGDNLLFDLLDSGFREKLDDLKQEETFKKAVLKSSVPTELKVKLMEYLKTRKTSQSIRVLASTLFDYFKNTKEVLENSVEETSVEDMRTAIIAQLNPSVIEYSGEQITLLITLIINEYIERYHIDHPAFMNYIDRVSRGEII